MNLDSLVTIGYRPWRPGPAVHDLDIWDKYDFPTCGTFRLGEDLVVFTLVTSAGVGSVWAYVPVPAVAQESVVNARFDTGAEFDAFLAGCFADRETVFASAVDLEIRSKSDGILIPPSRHGLLLMGAAWYFQQAAASAGGASADPDTVLRQTQGVLTALSA